MFTKTNIPTGVEARIEKDKVVVKGPKGELSRVFRSPGVWFELKDGAMVFETSIKGKKGKRIINSFSSHFGNMIEGVTKGYVYKLKIIFSHFPINVKLAGKDVTVENFFGEKKPRKTKLMDEVTATIEGDIITITGIDKEKTAQSAASIEKLTKRSGFDKRRFQDGIYITEKAGRKV
jgi:large subunit ribosomal protein L6